MYKDQQSFDDVSHLPRTSKDYMATSKRTRVSCTRDVRELQMPEIEKREGGEFVLHNEEGTHSSEMGTRTA